MHARRWVSGLAHMMMVIGIAACDSGSGKTTTPPPTPTASLAVSPTSVTVVAGQSTTVTAAVSRGGGFSGAVAIAASGAPEGVAVSGGTVAAGADSLNLSIATTSAALPGTVSLTVTGSAAGVSIAPVTLALTIAPPPAASLSLSPDTASLTAGGSTTVTASITRSGGFEGPVTISASGAPSGVTVTGGTIAAGAGSQLLTIAATPGAALGDAELSITASATGLTIAPATLTLSVEAAAVGQIGDRIEGERGGDQAATVALSADGSRVVIGAPFNDGNGGSAGHARVYQRSGNSWVQLGADLDGEAADDRFGGAVAISDDGSRIAIGSYLNDGGGPASGHVRVFQLIDSNWLQVGSDIDGPSGRGAGWSVAMSASGHRVVIGGPTPNALNGIVTVYEDVAGVWTQVGARFTGNLETGDSVAMSADGNRIAYGETAAISSSRPGSVQIHQWDGSSWSQVGTTIVGEAGGDTAGSSIALSSDGSTIAIGAPQNDGDGADGGGVTGGQVRVYRFAAGVWTQLGVDLDGPAGAGLGRAVALSGAGDRLLAGAPGSIAPRLYRLVDGSWQQEAEPVFAVDRRAGSSVALSRDGTKAAIGAQFGDGAAGNASGTVRVYALTAP
ncbi:MAG: hypothetical protein C0434_01650 [Xanthomonadaceae bacterium]|nr:hypothetical protein [Xanthomonadaceae bacterium]